MDRMTLGSDWGFDDEQEQGWGRVYVGFIDSEKVYNRANREALYDVGVRLLSGITNMFVDSPACVKVEGGESERFKIDSGVRHGCSMYIWME